MESITQSFESLKTNLMKRMADFEEQQKTTGTPSTAATLAAEFAAFREFVRESFDCFQKQLHLLACGQDQLEMRARRKMLLLHGVAEVNEEKNSKTSQVVVAAVSKQLGLDDFSDNNIQRCQRLGRSASGDKPRPILLELESYRIRDNVWFNKTKFKVQLPKCLQPMKYQIQYRAPQPSAAGITRTPEEIEQEIKKIEAQYEKLAQVFIDLPQDAMWNEPPVVCQWQEQRKLWTSNYVNDYKFNEDKLTIQFRTGVLWPIGIATLKYSNLPFQGWDVKPDPNSKGVLVTVTGLCVTVTLLCMKNSVKLKFIANSATSALKEHYNKKYSVKKMVQIMQDAACDFFPAFDAHNSVEGSAPKEWVMERHTYHAMAFLSRAYNFQWSRWNAEAGYRNMIMQLREAIDTKRESKLQLLYVTPQSATILKCHEMTPEINHEPMLGLPFFPDLFTLNLSYGSVDARRTTFNMGYKLVETVFDLLQELKLLSYS